MLYTNNTIFVKVGVPYLMGLWKRKKEREGTEEKLTRAEQEFTMEHYDPMLGSVYCRFLVAI